MEKDTVTVMLLCPLSYEEGRKKKKRGAGGIKTKAHLQEAWSRNAEVLLERYGTARMKLIPTRMLWVMGCPDTNSLARVL